MYFWRANMAKRILVAGSSNIDFLLSTPYIPAPGETMISSGKYAFTPGGKGANAAVAAASFGADVVFCSRVGDDAYGDRLVELSKSAVLTHATFTLTVWSKPVWRSLCLKRTAPTELSFTAAQTRK
jgi:sugar/nucleoside kinase (ribokinase family)